MSFKMDLLKKLTLGHANAKFTWQLAVYGRNKEPYMYIFKLDNIF